MMHGKSILIDNHWASMGSANLDPHSFFHNDELNLCSNAPTIVHDLEAFFEHGFSNSHLVEIATWKNCPFSEKMMGLLGNFFYWQF
jgi:cardiolipin synthase